MTLFQPVHDGTRGIWHRHSFSSISAKAQVGVFIEGVPKGIDVFIFNVNSNLELKLFNGLIKSIAATIVPPTDVAALVVHNVEAIIIFKTLRPIDASPTIMDNTTGQCPATANFVRAEIGDIVTTYACASSITVGDKNGIAERKEEDRVRLAD